MAARTAARCADARAPDASWRELLGELVTRTGLVAGERFLVALPGEANELLGLIERFFAGIGASGGWIGFEQAHALRRRPQLRLVTYPDAHLRQVNGVRAA